MFAVQKFFLEIVGTHVYDIVRDGPDETVYEDRPGHSAVFAKRDRRLLLKDQRRIEDLSRWLRTLAESLVALAGAAAFDEFMLTQVEADLRDDVWASRVKRVPHLSKQLSENEDFIARVSRRAAFKMLYFLRDRLGNIGRWQPLVAALMAFRTTSEQVGLTDIGDMWDIPIYSDDEVRAARKERRVAVGELLRMHAEGTFPSAGRELLAAAIEEWLWWADDKRRLAQLLVALYGSDRFEEMIMRQVDDQLDEAAGRFGLANTDEWWRTRVQSAVEHVTSMSKDLDGVDGWPPRLLGAGSLDGAIWARAEAKRAAYQDDLRRHEIQERLDRIEQLRQHRLELP